MTEIVCIHLDDGRTVEYEKTKLTRGEGYVYLVRFAGGVLKVDKSNNPWSRLGGYVKHARLYGGSVLDAWISPPHEAYGQTEELLIAYCAKRGKAASGKEYFIDLDYAAVLAAMQRVTYLRAEDFYDLRRFSIADAKEFIRQRRAREANAGEFTPRPSLLETITAAIARPLPAKGARA